MKLHPLPSLAVLAASLALVGVIRGDETTSSVKCSDPTKPCTLKVHVGSGNVRIKGADTDKITVVSDSTPENKTRKDGLRVLTAASSYKLEEKANVVTLDHGSGAPAEGGANFEITVPRKTSVNVASAWGGEVVCSEVGGDIEVKNLNGEVRLNGITGGAVVETMNGGVHATIRELHNDRPLCFTSMNGDVSISLPADAQACVRLRTQNGSILTDFDDKVLVTKTEMPRSTRSSRSSDGSALDAETREAIREAARQSAQAAREAAQAFREAAQAAREGVAEGAGAPVPPTPPIPPMPPLPAMTGGKIVSGTLNGGGAFMVQVATMNGDITFRKLQDQK